MKELISNELVTKVLNLKYECTSTSPILRDDMFEYAYEASRSEEAALQGKSWNDNCFNEIIHPHHQINIWTLANKVKLFAEENDYIIMSGISRCHSPVRQVGYAKIGDDTFRGHYCENESEYAAILLAGDWVLNQIKLTRLEKFIKQQLNKKTFFKVEDAYNFFKNKESYLFNKGIRVNLETLAFGETYYMQVHDEFDYIGATNIRLSSSLKKDIFLTKECVEIKLELK
jgi:hypothetical protein